MIGVTFGEERFLNDIVGKAIRLIIALTFFVLDNPALIIELFLSDSAKQMAHPVTFKEQRAVKRSGWHILKIIGAVKPCCAVKIGCPNLLERFKKIAG